MEKLSALKCEACDINSKLLSEPENQKLLSQLEGWNIVIDEGIQKLERTFVTGNYGRSMSFTNAVAELAENTNHHPQLIVDYGKVTVIWWTHKIKGLHKNDFILAAKTSSIF